MLTALRERGYRLGVFSDYPATEKLKSMGVIHCFDTVVSVQHSGVRGFKPHTNGFGIAASQLGLQPGEVLYVGDRMEVDGWGARASGMAAAILGRGDNDTDGSLFALGSLTDLLLMLPGNFAEKTTPPGTPLEGS